MKENKKLKQLKNINLICLMYIIKEIIQFFLIIFSNICNFFKFKNYVILNDSDYDNSNKEKDSKEENIKTQTTFEKFEHKYLEKFKKFPNEFNFNEEEIIQENNEYIKIKNEYEKNLTMNETTENLEEDMHKKAHNIIINKKLDKLIDNYILEHTPLGNIYMRYNNYKQSFEYFSNSTIPYRYLEPVGRKYVITYWCKPIFVDIEQELNKAEEKYNSKKEKKIEYDKIKNINPTKFIAQLKNYNKGTKDLNICPNKNRTSYNVLPPQIRANLPNVNTYSKKQLLKENANRYTWEGRLTNFCPLKKINKKILDKKLTLTYSDFKKINNL